jgi:hypothetical protein
MRTPGCSERLVVVTGLGWRARVLLVATVGAALAGVFSAVGGSASQPQVAATLAVRQVGVTAQHAGKDLTYASWGVALTNRSKGYDALKVTIDVELLDANGDVIPDQGQVVNGERLRVIPAGQTVYLGAQAGLFGNLDVHGVRVTTSVGSTRPGRVVLPRVSDVRVDAATGRVTATVTNPYPAAISPGDYRGTAVFYDRQGRVIGGSDGGEFGVATLKPGASTVMAFSSLGAVPRSQVGSARVTVLPEP